MPNYQNEKAASSDGYVNPATGGDGGDRPIPKVTQKPVVAEGYTAYGPSDQGQRKQTAEGGASKSNDGYNNLGINTDGPGKMGQPGQKYPKSIKATDKGLSPQWDS